MDVQQRTCNFCDMQDIEDEAHVTLKCPAYEHIRSRFQQLTKECNTFEDLLSKTDPNPTALGTFLTKILEHHKILSEASQNEKAHVPLKRENLTRYDGPMGHFGPSRT